MSALGARIVLAASLAAALSPALLPGQAGPETRQRAGKALALARQLAEMDKAPPGLLEDTHRLYAQAIRESTGPQRLEAYNSYGVFLLRQGDPARAAVMLRAANEELASLRSPEESGWVETMRTASHWVGDVNPVVRSRLLYNYGVALERSGHSREAAPVFLESFQLDPGFMPACDAVFRTSRGLPDRAAELRVPVVESLLGSGDLESARSYLRTSFQEDSAQSYPELTELWVRYLTAARIGPGQDHRLEPAQRPWGQAVQERLALVERSYSGELPLLLDPAEGRELTRPWQESEDSALAFSGLLRMIGDELVRLGRPREALSRYALSWSSAGNLDSAVRLVGLLRSARKEVDPNGEVLGKLLSVFFAGGGKQHLDAGGPGALRFHTALATLLENAEGSDSADDPGSALYQWERALAVQDGMAAAQPAPGLHAHLATAYKQAGRMNEALSQFLAAGEKYLVLGRPDAAETQLLRAEEIGIGTGIEEQRLASLQTAVAQSKAARRSTGSPSDVDITTDVQYRLAADPVFRGKVMDVTTVNGRVTVSAKVDKTQVRDIEHVVLTTDGVTGIQVDVARPPR